MRELLWFSGIHHSATTLSSRRVLIQQGNIYTIVFHSFFLAVQFSVVAIFHNTDVLLKALVFVVPPFLGGAQEGYGERQGRCLANNFLIIILGILE